MKINISILIFFTSYSIGFSQFKHIYWDQKDSLVQSQKRYYDNCKLELENKKENRKLVRYQYDNKGFLVLKQEIDQTFIDTIWQINAETLEDEVGDINTYNDSPNGNQILYYKNKRIQEKGILNDHKELEWVYYKQNGVLWKKEIFEKGNLQQIVEYYPNQQKKFVGYYKTTRTETIEIWKTNDTNEDIEVTIINEETEKFGKWVYYKRNGKIKTSIQY